MAQLKIEDRQVVLFGPYLLASSKTFTVGEFVAFSTSTAGVLDNATATVSGTSWVAGKLEAIVDKDGNPMVDANGKNITSIATGSSNTTYYGLIIPAFPEYTFEVPANAALGTTTGSNKAGVFFNLASSTQIDESSVVLPAGTGAPKQLISLGPARDNSTGALSTTNLLVKFVKSVWQS
jgi:hypothetical protein